MSATVDGAEGPTADSDPQDFKDCEKPGEAKNVANTEVPSEEEASASRMQLDHNFSDEIRLSGERPVDYVSHISSR